jgi:hypothetical protein
MSGTGLEIEDAGINMFLFKEQIILCAILRITADQEF